MVNAEKVRQAIKSAQMVKAGLYISQRLLRIDRGDMTDVPKSKTQSDGAAGGLVAIDAAAVLALFATAAIVILFGVSWWWWLPLYSALGVVNAAIIIGFLALRGR